MPERGKIATLKRNARTVFIAICVLWVAYALTIAVARLDLLRYGVFPRTRGGLIGIIAGPLLHANLMHLVGNSIALAVLAFLALTYSRELTLDVVVITWIAHLTNPLLLQTTCTVPPFCM